jgi:hypothetical protein
MSVDDRPANRQSHPRSAGLCGVELQNWGTNDTVHPEALRNGRASASGAGRQAEVTALSRNA